MEVNRGLIVFSIAIVLGFVDRVSADDSTALYHLNQSVYFINNPSFRGERYTRSSELWVYTDFSWSGISGGINLSAIPSDGSQSAYDAFISYSYSTEMFYYTGGFNYVDHFDIDESEVFFEVSGREDYFGFTPNIFISQEMNGNRSYVDASISRGLIRGKWLINPHASVSFGDYFSDEFKVNHIDLGIDATKRIDYSGSAFYFTASLNAIKPLEAISSTIGDNGIYVQSSLGLIFMF